jgi:hypothetical protein
MWLIIGRITSKVEGEAAMTTDVSLVFWVVFILVLLAIAGRRSAEVIQPPQIVYVQAQAPQSSGASWVIIIILGLLLLKATGIL